MRAFAPAGNAGTSLAPEGEDLCGFSKKCDVIPYRDLGHEGGGGKRICLNGSEYGELDGQ